MDEHYEVTAKTVDEAIELAIKELGVERAEVEVEVLSRGRAGFLGIGAEPARVRVWRRGAAGARRPTAAPSGAAAQALEVVNKLMAATGAQVRAALRSAHDPDTGGPIIDLEGEDSGLLIGRRGETLQSVQFLVNLLVNRHNATPVRVVLDVEHYRERRHRALRDMALKAAQRVAQTGRPITLEPMPPAERRIVHLALADNPHVTTLSVGTGEGRKVSILPRKGSLSGSGRPSAARQE